MQYIPVETLRIGPRQRKKRDPEKLANLRESILSKGLLHPPVVSIIVPKEHYELRTGERRTIVMQQLIAESLLFFHDGKLVPEGQIPVSFLHEMSEVELFEAEFEENMMREDLSWQDQAAALAELHRLRSLQNDQQTVIATAREIEAKISTPENPKPLYTIRQDLAKALIVAPYLNDPMINKARTVEEASQAVLKREHEHFRAKLIAKQNATATITGVECSLIHGDSLKLMPDMDPEQFDLILSDPPYGQDANTDAYGDRTVIKHNYDDSPEHAWNVTKAIILEGWRLTKPKANLFLFINFKNWFRVAQLAAQMGWNVWPYPIIWQKSTAEGLAPWKRLGFARTYETIFWATKGQRGIDGPALDILTEGRVGRSEREHGAEKPLALIERLVSLATIPGERVFDPCAGSGTTLVASKRLRRASIGIEISDEYHSMALGRLADTKEGGGGVEQLQTTFEGMPLPPDL